nr:tRNA (adenosine(37)-N6)-dimethylallyltransferase MiaA [Lachnospira multipara]
MNNLDNKEPLVIISGPTAVGKTKTSISLAKAINGSIISADSMQVYRGMDIGTAKITKEEMDGVKHYLIDCLEPTDEFNVMIFKDMAKKAIEEIRREGKIPIIVGGTGFYVQAVLYDIEFTKTEDDNNEYRNKLYEKTLCLCRGLAIRKFLTILMARFLLIWLKRLLSEILEDLLKGSLPGLDVRRIVFGWI